MDTQTAHAHQQSVTLTPEESLWHRIDTTDLWRTLFVAACTIVVGFGVTWPGHAYPAVGIAGLVAGCWPIVTEAIEDARQHRMSMELSMLIAIVAAAAIGEWVTALLVTTFVLAAEILEDLSMDRGRDALTDLMAFLPETVRVRRGDALTTVALADVTTGDAVAVAPGERIPVDGVVVSGQSTADQSRITGESLPVEIAAGSTVYAGSINQVGAVEIRAEKVGADSSYGRIIEAVRLAQSSEPPVQRLADKLAARLVYLALGGAVLTYIVTRDLTAAISVILVAGACGVAAGTPLAVLASIARAARCGAFVKDGAHLEELSAVDTVVFDKTGTLTEGTPRVTQVIPASGRDADEVVLFGASAEYYSEHPLGKALAAYAKERGVETALPEDFTYQPGRGVSATVDGHIVLAGNRALVENAPADSGSAATSVHVAVDGSYYGSILLADSIRPSAQRAIADLHEVGLRTLLLTGDREQSAQSVARQLGIDTVRAELLPEDKLQITDAEKAAGHSLAMVGDGVNDAPALARANVGIAMGSGTDIARESADVVLISSDLNDLVATIRVARRARSIVMTNFFGTIIVDVIGMILAAIGILGPVLAALVHVGSETAFIANSARLIPGRAK